jgi:hypothetical protein
MKAAFIEAPLFPAICLSRMPTEFSLTTGAFADDEF